MINNVSLTLNNVPSDTTLLQYLRQDLQLTGTKEGCASGDCGACTVLVSKQRANGIVYNAVNSCILPLGSLQDCSVITIEGLSSAAGDLHPVQQAMVDCHGSQCGFCTPGFVMSLAALHHTNSETPTADLTLNDAALRTKVIDAISGNLCRCTGYRPIVEAGVMALKTPTAFTGKNALDSVQEWTPSALFSGNNVSSDTTANGLSSLLETTDSHYWQPTREAELQQLLSQYPQARMVAGGTDLMLEVSQLYKRLPFIIDVSKVRELNRIDISDDEIRLGAAVAYSDIEQQLAETSPEFIRLLHRLGSRQIRNRGTLGGNICNASPIADCPPFLLVLDADLLIGNAQGEYRRQALRDFYLGYKQTTLAAGEYLAQVILKRSALANPIKLYKISKRYEDDISAVMGAFRRDLDGIFYIAFGGMAAIPKRASLTEAFLNQHASQLTEALVEQACTLLCTEFSPLTDVRASAAYRMAMACNLLKKACAELVFGEPAIDLFATTVSEGAFDHA